MEFCNIEIQHLSSCLSLDVKALITEIGLSNHNENVISAQSSTCIIDWGKFERYFASTPGVQKYLSEVPNDKKTYSLLVETLAPCLNNVNHHLNEVKIEELENNLRWTNFHKVFIRSYELLNRTNNKSYEVLAILIITAYLERALGNLFLLKGQIVPFLIKDLINSVELKDIIGLSPVIALRIIMGSPLSLNLRNVLWHGFASPTEIDKRYGNFLMAVLASLPSIIQIDDNQLIYRKQLSFTHCECFPDFNDENYESLYSSFKKSPIVYNQMLPYWTTALELFRKEKYGESLFLCLPALESCFRVLYGALNKCPKNIFTAENETLYLTFDEIYAEYTHSGELNKLRDFLGDNFLEMFLDLLMYEEGPRVRDRISHGEVSIDEISRELTSHILHLSSAICYKVYKMKGKETCQYLEKLLFIASKYKVKFHPYAKLKATVLQILLKLEEIAKRSELNLIPFENRSFLINSSEINIVNYILSSKSYGEINKTFEVTNIISIYSTHKELILVKIGRQISSNGLNVASNLVNVLSNREELIKAGKLRSRQRLNYEKLLNSLKVIKTGIEMAIVLSIYILVNTRKLVHMEDPIWDKFIKLLKRILQCVENLKTLTDINHNQWDKCCNILTSMNDYVKNYTKHSQSAFLII